MLLCVDRAADLLLTVLQVLSSDMPPKRRGAQAAESQPDEPEPDVEPNVNDKLFTDSLVKGLKDDEVRKALGLKDFENTLAQLVTKCSKLEKTVIDKDAKIILLEKSVIVLKLSWMTWSSGAVEAL